MSERTHQILMNHTTDKLAGINVGDSTPTQRQWMSATETGVTDDIDTG